MNDLRTTTSASTVLSALNTMKEAPGVVHVVANGVHGDSRVLKCAQASIAAGRTTVIVGIGVGAAFEHFEIEGVPVLIVPSSPRAGLAAQATRDDTLRAWGRRERDLSVFRAVRALRSGQIRRALKATARAIRPRTGEPSWSARLKRVMDSNVAFTDILDALEPATVHVHDAFPLPAACVYSARQAVRHRRAINVIYDAHECLPELVKSFPTSPFYISLSRIESRYIDNASSVITVSSQIAALLRSRYGLASLPGVVTNAPSIVRTSTGRSVREHAGLDQGTPLAVYSGWIAFERGIGTAVRALPAVPQLHLALVCNRESKELTHLLELAEELGVANRLHLAPYVPPSQVTEYLASADIGLIPLQAGGHYDLSLATKFREYLHAGLALVVSNNLAMKTEIELTGIGRFFESGNVEDLVTQLKIVLRDPTVFTSKITKDLLVEHSWEAQVQTLLRYYAIDGETPSPDLQQELSSRLARTVAAQDWPSLSVREIRAP